MRDIFNERPTKEEQALLNKPTAKKLGKSAVIHTSRGDIHIKLFGEELVVYNLNTNMTDARRL